MKILALDTSGTSESVAVFENGKILEEIYQEQTSSHTVSLLSLIQETLKKSKTTLSEIGCFAVTMGPGSFTGIRIGISTVKAFSQVFKRPVVGVSTLFALARPYLNGERLVVSCLDARMGEVYASAYQRKGEEILTLLPPKAQLAEELIQKLTKQSGEKLILGTGVRAYPEILSRVSGAFTPNSGGKEGIRAGIVARIAEEMVRQGGAVSGRDLKATYLRVSTAEKKLFDKRAFN